MINLTSEEILPLIHAPQHLSSLCGGYEPHESTLRRWAGTGLRGVRLETIKVGARRCTSREALERFVKRLTEVTDGGQAGGEHRAAPEDPKWARRPHEDGE